MRKVIRNILLLLALICAIMAVVSYVKEQKAGSGYDLLRDAVKKEASTEQAPAALAVTEAISQETEDAFFETETELPETELPETELPETEETVLETETEVQTENNLISGNTDSEIVYADRVLISTVKDLQVPVDFEELQEINPDIYAWLEVEGTLVDYPVAQNPEDNTFYLDRSFERKKAAEGTIFSEDYNTLTFDDPHTVLYGHNMKNEAMFGSLHRFMDRSFFNNNREVTVYLPDEIRRYEVFAAYLYDSRHLLLSFNCSSERVFEYYLNQIESVRGMSSFVDDSYDLTAKDKIITLSTCYQGRNDIRYLVQAVLVSIEKNMDDNG